MKLSDIMEIVVIDGSGMHKMDTTEDIDEYLEENGKNEL